MVFLRGDAPISGPTRLVRTDVLLALDKLQAAAALPEGAVQFRMVAEVVEWGAKPQGFFS